MTGSDDSRSGTFQFGSPWLWRSRAPNQQEGKRSAMTKLKIMPRYAKQARTNAQMDVAHVMRGIGLSDNLGNEVYNEAPATPFRASTLDQIGTLVLAAVTAM